MTSLTPPEASTLTRTSTPRSGPVTHYLARLGRHFVPDVEEPDQQFLAAYRILLVGQYHELEHKGPSVPAQQVADEVVAKGSDATWEDLYKLESAIIALEPDEMLRRRAWSLRSEYKEIATPAELLDYEASKPPKDTDGDISALRADLLRIQQEIHWRYLATWVFENFRTNLTKKVCAIGVVFVAAVFILSWAATIYRWDEAMNLNWPLILTVLGAGFLGGLTSTIRRIQQAKLAGNADIDLANLLHGNMSVYLSPLLGSVFAFVLFLLFSARLADGGAFPHVSFDLVYSFSAADFDGTEFGKLLVWSFIAGFAETFVPDKLSRLANENADSGGKAKGG